ncbi:hypothetical protein B0H13DRAFT_2304266 [Mycena leptocephala]|nr:hypothetical protein B0H13DRAFT_2304266 [Mycena leptocephala]
MLPKLAVLPLISLAASAVAAPHGMDPRTFTLMARKNIGINDTGIATSGNGCDINNNNNGNGGVVVIDTNNEGNGAENTNNNNHGNGCKIIINNNNGNGGKIIINNNTTGSDNGLWIINNNNGGTDHSLRTTIIRNATTVASGAVETEAAAGADGDINSSFVTTIIESTAPTVTAGGAETDAAVTGTAGHAATNGVDAAIEATKKASKFQK